MNSVEEALERQRTVVFNNKTGFWETAIPCPYYFSLLPWMWRRLTGWRDEYGRKAQLMLPWE